MNYESVVLHFMHFSSRILIIDNCLLQPPILEAKEVSSINLWMNNTQARSSTHYDPHHNLLCIVSGRKQGKRFAFFKLGASY